MSEFEHRYWTSRDGLRLHCRDYAGRADRPPVLCLPGLTRNARDFDGLAARLAGEWRVLCPEMRGRGDSAWSRDSECYNPLQYADDLAMLLAETGITRLVAIGTSLGGLLTMLLAHGHPGLIAGAVLNDIGPVIEAAGLARIREYLGQGRSFPTWMHAARALEETQGPCYPDSRISDWLVMAKRVMTPSSNGRIVFDYDMKIAEPFARADGAAPADLWPAFDALADKPLLLLRGELSDILSAETLRQMVSRCAGADAVTIARTGHAPTLDEPAADAAIARLLARVS